MDYSATRNILSLCAGVGGLELGIMLALDYLGEASRGVCYVEREAAAAVSLAASMDAGWFHHAPVWSDMRTFDGKPWRGIVDILASGDPCQENSVAGKRAGASGAMFLAPEVVRIADECRPDVIFRENVPGNADGQLEAIVQPLEGMGYRVAAGVFSSAQTGNTMRRERLFIMAMASPGRGRHSHPDGEICARRDATFDAVQPMGCANGIGRWEQSHDSQPPKFTHKDGAQLYEKPAVIPGPTDSRWRVVLDRFPEYQPALSKEEAQSLVCRVIDAMAHRVERLRATGNGVDPMVAATAFLSLQSRLTDA